MSQRWKEGEDDGGRTTLISYDSPRRHPDGAQWTLVPLAPGQWRFHVSRAMGF